MKHLEKVYIAKLAGAAPGVWAGKGITGAEKGVGALSGVTAGLQATPIPVTNTRNLRRHNKQLVEMKNINKGLGSQALSEGIQNMESKTEGLKAKVPNYMMGRVPYNE